MRLIDAVSGQAYTLSDLFYDWMDLRAEDPWNHSIDFQTELFEILMASVNGRNDMDVSGMTPLEVSRYIIRLHNHLNPSTPWTF